MNIIDSIVVEEGLLDRANQGQLSHARAVLNKEYGRIDGEGIDEFSNDESSPFTTQTDDGYVGLEAPLG